MERSYDDPFAPTSADLLPSRPSIGSTSSRLQRKRSEKRVLSDANRLTTRPEEGGHRKSSIRDAVRKIFTRRSKGPESKTSTPSIQSTQPLPRSRPAHQSQPPEFAALLPTIDSRSTRAVSAPLRRANTSDELARIRSPNAVEFPKSRHLKPLVLPTPFDDPRSTLRRRKTLPSILIAPQDAKEIAAAINCDAPHAATGEQLPLPKTSKSAKRRSRSASDLKEQALKAGPQRNRSDEIRFWRESIQTAVRTSGYMHPNAAIFDAADIIKTPPRNTTTDARRMSRGSTHLLELQSAFGTELSRDLEDRVAHLEANLHSFQRSLNQLQKEKNRKIGMVVDDPPSRRYHRNASGLRSPSMLVEDLRLPIAPSQYSYGFEPAERPLNAPASRPARPPRPDEHVPPLPTTTQPAQAESSSKTAHRKPRRPSRPGDDLLPPTDNAAWGSLYRMLNDERSARKRLETELRDLRGEMSDLQHQVTSAQSHVHSQRSSYNYAVSSDAIAGSARLRDLLAATDSPPSRRSMSPPLIISPPANVVSRFSASTKQESEAGTTSVDAHEQDFGLDRTPRPDKNRRSRSSMEGLPAEVVDDNRTPTATSRGFPMPPSFARGGMF